MTLNENLRKVADHWSQRVSDKQQAGGKPKARWWQNARVVRHVNKRICGKFVDGAFGGDIEILRHISPGPFPRAVSIGCGVGLKEANILKRGIVENFVLYEVSSERCEKAHEIAKKMGVLGRVDIRCEDAFQRPVQPEFDLVYWSAALHHMFDTPAAVRWSRDVLVDGGVFYMNEFVGPTRMQYSPRQLELAERARAILPDRFLVNPHDAAKKLPVRKPRPDPEGMRKRDPSECADSERIVPAVKLVFPGAVVKPLGGVVYHIALEDVIANFTEEDEALLDSLMLYDEVCTEMGESLRAVAYAFKR